MYARWYCDTRGAIPARAMKSRLFLRAKTRGKEPKDTLWTYLKLKGRESDYGPLIFFFWSVVSCLFEKSRSPRGRERGRHGACARLCSPSSELARHAKIVFVPRPRPRCWRPRPSDSQLASGPRALRHHATEHQHYCIPGAEQTQIDFRLSLMKCAVAVNYY